MERQMYYNGNAKELKPYCNVKTGTAPQPQGQKWKTSQSPSFCNITSATQPQQQGLNPQLKLHDLQQIMDRFIDYILGTTKLITSLMTFNIQITDYAFWPVIEYIWSFEKK